MRLLEALASLKRTEDLTVPLVLSGRENEHSAQIRARAAELGLADTTHFLGFVPAEDMPVLYRQATVVIIPSLFEAAGGFGPLSEAFVSGTPAAVSNVNALPEEADDAALVFDPRDTDAIAVAIRRLWLDTDLARGWRGCKERVSQFTWDRTARTFRAHYRRIAGRGLTAQDEALVNALGLLERIGSASESTTTVSVLTLVQPRRWLRQPPSSDARRTSDRTRRDGWGFTTAVEILGRAVSS
jgi:hypothetical protein